MQAASHRGNQAGTDMMQCMMQMLQTLMQRRAEPAEVPLTFTPPKPTISALPLAVPRPSPVRPAPGVEEAATDDDQGADDADGDDTLVLLESPPARHASRPSVAETTASIVQALADRNSKNAAGAGKRRFAADDGPGCAAKSKAKSKGRATGKSTDKSAGKTAGKTAGTSKDKSAGTGKDKNTGKDKSAGKGKRAGTGTSKPVMGIEWSREQANSVFVPCGPFLSHSDGTRQVSESSLRVRLALSHSQIQLCPHI